MCTLKTFRFEGDQMVFETEKKQMEIFLHFEISEEMQIKSHSQVLNSINSINTQNTRKQCKMMGTLL